MSKAITFVRFIRRVRIGRPDECWEWTGNRPDGLYGHFSVGGRIVKAHRWIYEFINGPIGDGLLIRHKCDNPSCVNPRHLESGTAADNIRDCIDRGRRPDRNGELHPLARLGADQVRAIRLAAELGETQAAIGKRFGISRQHTGKIIRRENWDHV